MKAVADSYNLYKLRETLLAFALGVLSCDAVARAGALEEILVTASKRTQSIQDVSMTVTAFSEQEIREANINNADDVAALTPSLTITTNTQPFTASFRIRGIGTSQNDIALEPSVGIFVDDVFLSRSGLGMSDLTDIERIEVLHGPQGTLYGKNTNAGAVSIFTKRPNLDEYEGYVEATAGDYSMKMLTAAVSGPITESLAFRLSGNLHERDGYFDNGAGDDLNSADDWNLVAKLLFQPGDSLSVLVKASHVDRDNRCCAADAVQGESVNVTLAERGLPLDKNDPFDHEVAVDVDNEFTVETDEVSMVIDYDRDWGSIKSVTAWMESEGASSYDPDRSELDVMSYVGASSEGDTFSQELRFTSASGEHIDYQLGVFYFESSTNGADGDAFVFLGEDFVEQGNQQQEFLDLLPPIVPDVGFIAQPGDFIAADMNLETQTVAAFGQTTWHITERWRLTGGLRWTWEEKEADMLAEVFSTAASQALVGFSFLSTVTTPIDHDFTRDSDDINWLVNLSYDWLDDTMVFANVATGSKSGGFNTVNGTPEQREFEDETTLSYELGIKSTLLDARLRVNAGAFFTQIDDYQFQQQLDVGIGTIVSNRAEVEVAGLDLDIQAMPLPNLTLNAGLLYMDKYEITAGPQEGNDLGFTAEYSANLGATFFYPFAGGGVYMRGDYSWMDDHLTGSADMPEDWHVQDRELLSAKLGWRNDHWNVSVWGKNLTDDEYAGLTPATFPVTTMDAYFLMPPRTYGATLRYDF